MKIFYFYIVAFSLILIGCSPTYKISDFSSKDKFYEDFNKSANEKAVKVTLSNDSSFFISNGAAIVNDTLYSPKEEIKSGIKKIALSDTKGINYTNQSHTTALIVLNDGESYQAEQLRGNRDSIEFSFTKTITLKDVTSINDIKNISYKNHWLGVISGFIGGTIFGIIAGVIAIRFTPLNFNTVGNSTYYAGTNYTPAKIALSSCVILGIAYGWIKGFNYTYQFNP
jgi:hypothetical protein